MNILKPFFETKTLLVLVAYFISLQLTAQNVLISNQFNPNEPSIMIDPKNPKNMVAGANMDYSFTSSDSGYTWSINVINSSVGIWGDPTIVVDTAGHFYYFHLSNPPSGNWIDRIVCQKSTDAGKTWSDGSFAGLNGTKAQDKQWCAIDRTNNNMYLTWTQFDGYASTKRTDSSNILFSKSTDAGVSWSTPKRINKVAGNCGDGDSTVEGAVPAVGPNGEIYVSWAGPSGLVFNKSLDQGNTWLKQEVLVDSMPGGWNFSIPGLNRANGLPITTCDVSNGPNRGTIYINWSDQRNGINNTDIWLAKSTDGGKTWSKPQKVNDDNSNKQQFLTWMAIDQTNGYLYFVFYDRRNYTNLNTDVYMALSIDGGNTFINRKISETPFIPNAGAFLGDYTNLSVHNGVIRPIWTRLNNGYTSVWTNITRESDFLSTTGIETPKNTDNFSFENYPNPTEDYEYVSFKLHANSTVNLSIYDANGAEVANIIKNETRGYGKYVERISLSHLNIGTGTYFLRLEVNGKIKINRLIKI